MDWQVRSMNDNHGETTFRLCPHPLKHLKAAKPRLSEIKDEER